MFNFFKKKKKEPENLEEILLQFKDLKENFEILAKEIKNLKKESLFFIQKISILRYNPFSDVGSNQSFSIALLDGNDNGLVVTSLYTKEGNRVYGKSVQGGSSEYPLSEEEKEALKKAKNNYGRENSKKLNNQTAGGSGYGSC